MNTLKFLCIAPYEGMLRLMENIAAQRSDVELTVQIGDMEGALDVVSACRDQGYDAVISRGGTAEFLRQYVDIPICDMVPSAFDVLRTIRLAQGTEEAFAVVAFPSITKAADILGDILQYSVPVRTIHSAEECLACLRQLQSSGISTIVGDMISVRCARSIGMRSFLIVSGVESAEAAIDSTKEICSYHDSVNRQLRLLSGVLQNDAAEHEVYASDGTLVFSSLRSDSDELKGKLRKWVSTVITQGSVTRILTIGSSTLTVRGKLLRLDGEEYCSYNVSTANLDLMDRHKIQYLSVENGPPHSKPLEYYFGKSSDYADICAKCDRYALMNKPILIEGERGTGKNRLAHYIYSHSKLKHSSLIVIDACMIDDNGWNYLMQSDSSPLTDSGVTIFFCRVNAASHERQRQLWIYLRSGCVSQSIRLLFSYTLDPRFPIQQDLYMYLTNTMHCVVIRLEPLSRRRDEIPALISLYINAINVEASTRVIGMTPGAVALLQDQPWPQNADQLFSVVQDLVVKAKSSYISEEQVVEYLKNAEKKTREVGEEPLDLRQDLDKITRDIVRRVYMEENMNQAHTAKRLNISRTTVWRLLKDGGE